MKSLLERLFTKKSQFDYTIADYQPVKNTRLQNDVGFTEYQPDSTAEKDEMDIDKIYQSS